MGLFRFQPLLLWPLLCLSGSIQQTPVVLRPCSVDDSGIASPTQRYSFNTTTTSFELQDGSGRCLVTASCLGNDGDLAVLSPCTPDVVNACQAWNQTGPDGHPPNALIAPSGRCLDINGAHNPDVIDVWDCADPPTQWQNQQWFFNASSGAITSLDTDSSCCSGLCLTPGPSPPPNFKIGAYGKPHRLDAGGTPLASITYVFSSPDYFVDESSPVVYNGALLMFESIGRERICDVEEQPLNDAAFHSSQCERVPSGLATGSRPSRIVKATSACATCAPWRSSSI